MALITSCRRAWGQRSGSSEVNGARKHSLQWIVTTSTNDITDVQIFKSGLTATPDPLPDLNDTFPGDPSTFCKTLDAKQRADAPQVWDVTASYDNQFESAQALPKVENPLQRDVIYQVELNQYQRNLERDIKGKMICNTLFQPITPPIQQEDSRPVLVAQKNFATLAEVVGLMLEFKDAVNDRPFYGAPRRAAKIKGITAGSLQKENGTEFYQATIRIEFKGQDDAEGPTWDRVLLNTAHNFSPYYINSITKLPVDQFTDPQFYAPCPELTNKIHGVAVTEAQPIDENGVLIPKDPDTNKLEFGPVYVDFQTFPERNFGRLGI